MPYRIFPRHLHRHRRVYLKEEHTTSSSHGLSFRHQHPEKTEHRVTPPVHLIQPDRPFLFLIFGSIPMSSSADQTSRPETNSDPQQFHLRP